MVSEGHDDPWRAALYAAPAAALDVIPEVGIAKKVFGTAAKDAVERSLLRSAAVGGLKQAGSEAGTEGAQTAIERAAAYKDLWSDEARMDYLNSMALGALGGGVLGAATSRMGLDDKANEVQLLKHNAGAAVGDRGQMSLLGDEHAVGEHSKLVADAPKMTLDQLDDQLYSLRTDHRAALQTGNAAEAMRIQGAIEALADRREDMVNPDTSLLDDQLFRYKSMMHQAGKAQDAKEFYKLQDVVVQLEAMRDALHTPSETPATDTRTPDMFAPETQTALPGGVQPVGITMPKGMVSNAAPLGSAPAAEQAAAPTGKVGLTRTPKAPPVIPGVDPALADAAQRVGLALTSRKGKPLESIISTFIKAFEMANNGIIDAAHFNAVVDELKNRRYAEASRDLTERATEWEKLQREAADAAQKAKIGTLTRVPSPQGTANVSTPSAPVSPVGGSSPVQGPVVPGSVGVAGPGVSEPGGGGGNRPGPGAPVGVANEQVLAVPDAPSQQAPAVAEAAPAAEPVVRRKRKVDPAALKQAQAFVAPEAVETTAAPTTAEEVQPTALTDDQLEIAKLTGNTGGISEAVADITNDKTEDATPLTEEQVGDLIAHRLKDSPTKDRDFQVLSAYITAMRKAPQGEKMKVAGLVGKSFPKDNGKGTLGAVAVRKIGNTEALVRAGEELGFTREQVLSVFDLKDNSKSQNKPSKATEIEKNIANARKQYAAAATESEKAALARYMADQQEQLVKLEESGDKQTGDLNEALTEEGLGADGDTGETAFGGTDDARTWKQGSKRDRTGDWANDTDDAIHNEIDSLGTKMAQLKELAAEYQKTNPEQVPAVMARIAELEKQLADVWKKSTEAIEKLNKKRATESKKTDKKAAGTKKAKGKAVVEPAADEELDGRTDFEKAQDAWNEAVDALGGEYPRFDDLTGKQQNTFIRYGERNWTMHDVLNDIGKYGLQPKEEDFQALDTDEDSDGTAKFGKAAGTGAVKGHYTVKELIAELKSFMRADIPQRKLLVVGNISDLLLSDDRELQVLGASMALEKAYGVAQDGRAILIADRIKRGTGRAKFMHEVGGHLGIEELLTKAEFNRLVEQIKSWARKDDGSLESEIALEAVERVQFADTPDAQKRSELLAYFLEVAVGRGVDPTAAVQLKGPLGDWMRSLWAAMKRAITKLGMTPEKLTAKDVVNMAYGAARLSLDDNVRVNERAEMKFGKASDLADDYTPRMAKPAVSRISTTIKGLARRGLNKVIFTEDLMRRAVDKGLAAAKDLDTIYRQRTALAGQLEREVERIAQSYSHLPDEAKGIGERSANRFLYDSTREGKWGFQPDWMTEKVKVDEQMRLRFNAMDAKTQQFIKDVFKHGHEMMQLKQATVNEATASDFDSFIAAAKARGDAAKAAKLEADKKSQLARFDTLFRIHAYKPYTALRRFGDWVVIAKSQKYMEAEAAGDEAAIRKMQSDPDQYHVDFAESEGDANAMVRELREQGSFHKVGYRQKDMLAAAFDRGGMLSAFQKIKRALDADSEEMMLDDTASAEEVAAAKRAAATSAKAREVVSQLYLSMLAETSARKSEMRRKGVAGELDMLRSFATQGRADAQFVAAAKYNNQTQDAINAMRKQVRDGGDENAKSELFNEIALRHEQSMTPSNSQLAAKANRVTSVMLLAMSPAYYLQNLTQPMMMSLPFMAGRHNYLKVANAMLRAAGELGPMHKGVGLAEPFDLDKAPDDVRAMLKELANRGRIDIGINTELGRFQVGGRGKIAEGVNTVDDFLSNISQKMESINRIATAIAAYRIELAKTGDAAAATRYADDVLSQTHGDYTALNAPRAFNNPVGKIMLQFRKFQLIQATLLAKLIKGSITGPEQAANRKALAYLLTHTGIMAGAVGLPGYAAVSYLAQTLGLLGDDDEPEDATLALRRAIGDEDVADLLLKGVPAALGLDLSRKVGFTPDKLLPVGELDLSSRSAAEKTMATVIGGPAGGLALRAIDGLAMIRDGNYYRGLEQLMPTGVTNAMKAYRQATEGLTRRNGDALVTPEEVGALDTVYSGLGFTPTAQSNRAEAADVQYKYDQKLHDKATKIKNEYLRARKEGDSGGMSEARDKWIKLQEARVANGHTRQPLSELLRAGAQQAKRERETVGGVPTSKYNRGFGRELETLY
jgi:hypothetical protein